MPIRYRTSVVIIHKDHILGFHAEDPFNHKAYVFLPGGKIEPGETTHLAAIRETLEETGYAISINPEVALMREYDFPWNGKINHCQTQFFLGKLTSEKPQAVKDADYHRGVIWVPVQEIPKVFNYHQDILEPILELIKNSKK